MKIKDGASIQGLHIKMRPVLIAADAIWKGLGQELVITAGLDGEHSAGSLHYYGRALDFRTHYFTDVEKAKALSFLVMHLDEVDGQPYDVILHDTHIHVEYDPR